jgi:hypothetical protein
MFLAESLRASLPCGTAPPVVNLGIPRAFLPQGKPDQILADLGLDAEGVAASVHTALSTLGEPLGTYSPAPAPSVPVSPASSELPD